MTDGIKINADGVEVGEKGLEKLGKCIEYITPSWARDKALKSAQTSADKSKIASGELEYRDGVLVEPQSKNLINITPEKEFLEHCFKNVVYDEVRGQNNMSDVLTLTHDMLADVPDDEVSVEDIDPSFIDAWKPYAKSASEEGAKKLFAKILSGEIQTPGAYSTRTFQLIQHLSRKEAEMVQLLSQLTPLKFANIWLPSDANNKLYSLIDFPTIIELEAMGLIVFKGEQLTKSFNVVAGQKNSLLWKNTGVIVDNESECDIAVNLPCIVLTTLGENLIALVETDSTLDLTEYARAIAFDIKTKVKSTKIRIQIASIVHNNGETRTVDTPEEV